MKRMTFKNDNGIYFPIYNEEGNQIYCEEDYWEKLGKLEDIEEQLGCPIEVIFKALENGIETKKFGHNEVALVSLIDGVAFKNGMLLFPLKEYKKTWWLKRDKSE